MALIELFPWQQVNKTIIRRWLHGPRPRRCFVQLDPLSGPQSEKINTACVCAATVSLA